MDLLVYRIKHSLGHLEFTGEILHSFPKSDQYITLVICPSVLKEISTGIVELPFEVELPPDSLVAIAIVPQSNRYGFQETEDNDDLSGGTPADLGTTADPRATRSPAAVPATAAVHPAANATATTGDARAVRGKLNR